MFHARRDEPTSYGPQLGSDALRGHSGAESLRLEQVPQFYITWISRSVTEEFQVRQSGRSVSFEPFARISNLHMLKATPDKPEKNAIGHRTLLSTYCKANFDIH